MVLTIAPAVRGENLPQLLRSHALGLALGAVVAALVLTLAGAVLDAISPDASDAILVAVGLVALLWLPRTAGLGRGPRWPRRSWQVPEEWRYTLPMPVTLFGFGFLLGLGVLTSPVLPIFWVFLALTVSLASLPLALASWLAYAAMRWAMTARESRRVVASRVIPDEVHSGRGFQLARGLSVLALLATGLAGAAALQPTFL